MEKYEQWLHQHQKIPIGPPFHVPCVLPVFRASGNAGVELSHHADSGVNEVLLDEDGKSRVSLLRRDCMIGTMA